MSKTSKEKSFIKRNQDEKYDKTTINWLLGFGYALIRFSVGLLIHPYQTMQIIVEQKFFSWMALIPTGILGLIVGIWRIILLYFLDKSTAEWLGNQLVYSFLIGWFSLFCVCWQFLILYLFFRFKRAHDWHSPGK